MRIDRHRITSDEHRSIGNIVGRVHALRPDTPATASPGVPTLHVATSCSAAVAGHALRLDGCEPELADLQPMKQCVERLKRGSSALLILEDMPVEFNAPALLMLVGTMIGEVREYFGHGAPIIEVSDKDKIDGLRPSSDNRLPFDLHTDMSFFPNPPSFVCFLMLRTATSGGESLFCTADEIVAGLSADIIATLQKPLTFPAPPHRPHDLSRQFPILSYDPMKRANLRYRRDGLVPTDNAQRRALEALEHEAETHAVEIALRPGEMAIYSNTRILHGRRAFANEQPNGEARSALRAYVDFANRPEESRAFTS